MTGGGTSRLARLTPRQVVWIAALAGLLAFLPSLADGYVFDDGQLIVSNPYAHDLRHLGRCFTTDLWDTPFRPDGDASARFYRPLVCASYIVDWKLSGGSPFWFHLVNVLAHAAACALAARFALRWTKTPAAALLAALLFAVHPSRSENVIWISGRTDVLMGAFLLAANELAVSAAARSRAWARWGLSFIAWGAAVLSKEPGVCLPLLFGVEWVLDRDDAHRRRLAAAGGVAVVIAAVYLAVRAKVMPILPQEVEAMALPGALRVAYVLLSLGYYVERIVFPWPQVMHFRPVPVIDGVPHLFAPSVVLGAVAMLLIGVWVVRAWARDRALGAIVAASFVLLLPVINITYTGFLGTTADRFLYLPLLLVGVSAARTFAPGIEAWMSRSIAPLVVASLSLLLASVSWVRSLDYVSNDALFRRELDVNPDNPQALAILSADAAGQGDYDAASALIRHALSPSALQYRLLARPVAFYLALLEIQSLRLADGNVRALRTLLGQLAPLAEGRAPEPPGRAGDVFLSMPTDGWIQVEVNNAAPHLALAGAIVASRLGDGVNIGSKAPYDALVRRLARSIDPDAPLDGPAHFNLALALARGGDYALARQELERAFAASPTDQMRAATGRLLGTIESVEKLRSEAEHAPEPAAALARAKAFLDLGAYLRAARALRPAYLVNPGDAAVSAAYLEALTSAHLDSDASAVAAHLPGNPATRLQEIREALSPRSRTALGPPADEQWWATDPPPP